jgi:hypothetical protein
MSLLSRIDALPIRAKVLCGSFAYGYTEKGVDEPFDPVEFRVGAEVYRFERPYWYLATFEPWEWGSDFCDAPGLFEVNGVWEDVDIFAREQDYLDAFAKYVGDKPWKGGLMAQGYFPGPGISQGQGYFP